jgi:hypothetical protein
VPADPARPADPVAPRAPSAPGPGPARPPITSTARLTGPGPPPPAPGDIRAGPGRPGRSWLAAVVVASVVVAGAAFALGRRDAGTGAGPVSPDAVGSCFRYTAGAADRHVDRLVPCDEAHDGRVLAFAPGRASCPAGTDAVLALAGDPAAAGDVLCISERP